MRYMKSRDKRNVPVVSYETPLQHSKDSQNRFGHTDTTLGSSSTNRGR